MLKKYAEDSTFLNTWKGQDKSKQEKLMSDFTTICLQNTGKPCDPMELHLYCSLLN